MKPVLQGVVLVNNSNELNIVNEVLMYWNNTGPLDLVEMLFGEVYGGYERKWVSLYQQGFNHFWVALDDGKRQQLIDAAKGFK
jgi:hypothetical protein